MHAPLTPHALVHVPNYRAGFLTHYAVKPLNELNNVVLIERDFCLAILFRLKLLGVHIVYVLTLRRDALVG